MKMKIVVTLDSHNLGLIVTMWERQDILSFQVLERRDEEVKSPREFVREIRSSRNGHEKRQTQKGDFRGDDYVLSILQREPEKIWYGDDIATILAADFDYGLRSASSCLSRLKQHGFIKNSDVGKWMLTDKGKCHSQSDRLDLDNEK